MATTRVLFARHEEHEKQVLSLDGMARAVRRGQKIRDLGYKLGAMVLSPLPRAVATAVYMVEGWGDADVPLFIEERFGDLKTDKRVNEFLPLLKARAKADYGDDSDANLAKAMLMLPQMHEPMLARAHEGADALLDIAASPKFQDKTVLVTSHGVARMEIVLNWLSGKHDMCALDISGQIIARGEVTEIVFENEGGKVELKSIKPMTLLDD